MSGGGNDGLVAQKTTGRDGGGNVQGGPVAVTRSDGKQGCHQTTRVERNGPTSTATALPATPTTTTSQPPPPPPPSQHPEPPQHLRASRHRASAVVPSAGRDRRRQLTALRDCGRQAAVGGSRPSPNSGRCEGKRTSPRGLGHQKARARTRGLRERWRAQRPPGPKQSTIRVSLQQVFSTSAYEANCRQQQAGAKYRA